MVVTPRTIAAALYVGMTRGRESNHAHVVCDSHDHTEFELGDLTGEQAFAAATLREPDGQLSAHAVSQRWDAGRGERTVARAADRKRQQVTDWWTTRERGLPPAMRSAIAPRHREILDVLVRVPDNEGRRRAISSAASSIDWRRPAAADRFLDRLKQLVTTITSRRTPQPGQDRVARHER